MSQGTNRQKGYWTPWATGTGRKGWYCETHKVWNTKNTRYCDCKDPRTDGN